MPAKLSLRQVLIAVAALIVLLLVGKFVFNLIWNLTKWLLFLGVGAAVAFFFWRFKDQFLKKGRDS